MPVLAIMLAAMGYYGEVTYKMPAEMVGASYHDTMRFITSSFHAQRRELYDDSVVLQ